jgi:hypothetical protein
MLEADKMQKRSSGSSELSLHDPIDKAEFKQFRAWKK